MFQISQISNLYFGEGSWKKLGELATGYGKQVLLLTGKSSFSYSTIAQSLLKDLKNREIEVFQEIIGAEPQVEDIDSIVSRYRNKSINLLVSIGGGSVIDAGKAVSAMLMEEGSIAEYLEGVGDKQASGLKVPFIAMPTTAGTGSEATKNAVITKLGKDGFKKSLRHDNFIPDCAIISPEFALNCPPEVTAASGLDALTQLIESYLSTKANSFTDMLATDGIQKIFNSLERACAEASSIEARSDMAFAAYLSGINLANAGLGVVHGFAQPLGSLFPVPHGVVCGTLVGIANRMILEAAESSSNEKLIAKMASLGALISNEKANIDLAWRFVYHVEELVDKLRISKLGAYGIELNDFDRIIAKTGLKNCPVQFNEEELKEMISARL